MAKTDLAKAFNGLIAIGDLGTQLFWLNKTSEKFEYALPVVAGAEFGGDTETLEAPESDDPTVAKISGRTTLNDVTYNANYTKDRYKRLLDILDVKNIQTYMEVFSDGSAMIFAGTAGQPTIQSGDVRPIEFTIAPQTEEWVEDIASLTANEIELIQPLLVNASGKDITLTAGEPLPFDLDTIPSGRVGYTEENLTEAEDDEEEQQGE